MNKDIFLNKLKEAVSARKLLKDSFNNIVSILTAEGLPTWLEGSIEYLVEKEQWEEINNRFFKTIEFCTAGMRGLTV